MPRDPLDLDSYDTDKVSHRYIEIYDPVLEPYVDSEIKLLELGIHRGGSLHLWRDFFPQGEVTGIDLELPEHFKPGERVRVFAGDQADTAFLSRVAREVAPGGFDVIIDDASHLGEPTRTSFWHLFEHHLKPGGLYAIEDWGTGYWWDWPDGRAARGEPQHVKLLRRLWPIAVTRLPPPIARRLSVPLPSHSYGMVGFVKQLIDEQGAAALTRRRTIGTETRRSRFEQMVVTENIVFVTKSRGVGQGAD
jgi:SAM-dependent methyltransferase